MSCDDLNMQYPNKKTNFNHPQYRASAEIAGGNGGRRPVDNPTTSSNQIASGSSFNFITGGGEMGKLLFTASQWQEFESQTMIYKYIMASIPVPPQLLIPLSIQSNRSGRDLRFSNGSDPEPWRCRRTDGKKWRCSKDAMPDQKYCDRHAHKNRPRSRKPVETQSQNTKLPSNPSRSNHNYHPTLSMPTSCQQSRFTKSGTIPLSSLSQKIQKPMHSASVGSKRDHFCHQDLEGNHQDDCSLTLSMQSCGNNDQDFFQMGIGMWNADADGSNPPNQWVNQGSWLGGPLGEALCLGIASTQKEPPNVSSLHGHSNQDLYQD